MPARVSQETDSFASRALNDSGGALALDCVDLAEEAYQSSHGPGWFCLPINQGIKMVACSRGVQNGAHLLCLVFRGTDNEENVLTDLNFTLSPVDRALALPANPVAHVHNGFQEAYLEIRPGLLDYLESTKDQHGNSAVMLVRRDQRERTQIQRSSFHCAKRNRASEMLHVLAVPMNSHLVIRLVGHSLGGALATLAALDLANAGFAVELITFGCPKVGDAAFAQLCASRLGSHVARFVNYYDPVHGLPPAQAGFVHICNEITLDACITSAFEVAGETLQNLTSVEGMHTVVFQGTHALLSQHKLTTYRTHIMTYNNSFGADLLRNGFCVCSTAGPLVTRGLLMASFATMSQPLAAAFVATVGQVMQIGRDLKTGFSSLGIQIEHVHTSVLKSVEAAIGTVVAHLDQAEARDLKAHCTVLLDIVAVSMFDHTLMHQIVQLQNILEKLRLRAEEKLNTQCLDAAMLELLLRGHLVELYALSATATSTGIASKPAEQMLQQRSRTIITRLGPILGEWLYSTCESPAVQHLSALAPTMDAIMGSLGSSRALSSELQSAGDYAALLHDPDSVLQRCRICLQKPPLGAHASPLAWFRQVARGEEVQASLHARFALGANCWRLGDIKGMVQQWEGIPGLLEIVKEFLPASVDDASALLGDGKVVLVPCRRHASLQRAIDVAVANAAGEVAVVRIIDAIAEDAAISINQGDLTLQFDARVQGLGRPGSRQQVFVNCRALQIRAGAVVRMHNLHLMLNGRGIVAKDCQLELCSSTVVSSSKGIEVSGASRIEFKQGSIICGRGCGVHLTDTSVAVLGNCKFDGGRCGVAVKAIRRSTIELENADIRARIGPEGLVLEDHARLGLDGQYWRPRGACCPDHSQLNLLD